MERLFITNTKTGKVFKIEKEDVLEYFNQRLSKGKYSWGEEGDYELSLVENIDAEVQEKEKVSNVITKSWHGYYLRSFIIKVLEDASYTKADYLTILKSDIFQSIWILLEIGKIAFAKNEIENLTVNALITTEIKTKLVDKCDEILNKMG